MIDLNKCPACNARILPQEDKRLTAKAGPWAFGTRLSCANCGDFDWKLNEKGECCGFRHTLKGQHELGF